MEHLTGKNVEETSGASPEKNIFIISGSGDRIDFPSCIFLERHVVSFEFLS